ncbi:MAG: 1-(5-phosphoribosyl)-5-[(5-phosphoribosylamino)methylideneamino]imidazole-4-carboxamide isomerase [Actinomycetota bacterium]|nr:1-(5-phosphoribosyl)-5-[(5-phosphoribosylamino)methylideneamino]imidazole-4-carboxamide isomerase [Actinomycetota bacterium]
MIVFPAIDILAGKCVRLHQGRYDAVTVYADDPSEVARLWQAQGAEWLHVVDLDGAKDGRPVNLEAVEKIAARVDLPVQYGGGAREEADLRRLFNLGVRRIVLGTTLITDPEFAAKAVAEFGDALVAGVDARNGKAAVAGWREDTDINAAELAGELQGRGIARVIYTDISVDGTRRGPNLEATRTLAESLAIPVIASGGVSALSDIRALTALEGVGVEGVIIGSALYERSFELSEALKVAGRC